MRRVVQSVEGEGLPVVYVVDTAGKSPVDVQRAPSGKYFRGMLVADARSNRVPRQHGLVAVQLVGQSENLARTSFDVFGIPALGASYGMLLCKLQKNMLYRSFFRFLILHSLPTKSRPGAGAPHCSARWRTLEVRESKNDGRRVRSSAWVECWLAEMQDGRSSLCGWLVTNDDGPHFSCYCYGWLFVPATGLDEPLGGSFFRTFGRVDVRMRRKRLSTRETIDRLCRYLRR